MRQIGFFCSFICNGARTLLVASRGRYSAQTDDVRQMRREILSHRPSDAAMLLMDRRNIAADMRLAFRKLTKEDV